MMQANKMHSLTVHLLGSGHEIVKAMTITTLQTCFQYANCMCFVTLLRARLLT